LNPVLPAFAELNPAATAVKLLSQGLQRAQLSHAYLFKGPTEQGLALSVMLAQALFCADQGCGHCVTCRSLLAYQYPDFHLIRAEGEGRNSQIKLAQIHRLSEQVALPPTQSHEQIFVVQQAENLNKYSSNALLKTLEEPISNSIICLLTPSLSRILPTIRSRVQVLELSDCFAATHTAALPEALWSWEALEAIQTPQQLASFSSHLDSLSTEELETQLLIFQRACWLKIRPFILSKHSLLGLKRARAYLELFENALAQLRAHAHPKLLCQSLAQSYLALRMRKA